MTWRFRPGMDPIEQLADLEQELGIQNLNGIEIDAENGFLFVFTDTKKFRITMTEV